jgi:glycosyltransferase involved in cell wall biosynthesis
MKIGFIRIPWQRVAEGRCFMGAPDRRSVDEMKGEKESSSGKRSVILFSHASDLSGAPIALVRLAENLPRHGFRPLVLLPHSGELEELLSTRGVQYRVLKKPFRVIDFIRTVRKEAPSLIHVNSLVSTWPVLVSRTMKKPVIWHVHEFLGKKRLYAALICLISNGVILISREQLTLFRGKPKATRIPNGVDTVRYENVSPSFTITGEREGGRKTMVLFLGRIDPNKGLLDLARAASILKERRWIHYVVAGGVPKGGDRYGRAVRNFLKSESLERCFHFLGYRQDIPEIIASCDILCQPSYSDTFPLVLLEAMASALPVIGTSVGEVPYIIDEGRTGFVVQPGDYESLADRIKRLDDDPDLRARMGMAGKKRVKEEYEIRIHAGRVAEFYRNVLVRFSHNLHKTGVK